MRELKATTKRGQQIIRMGERCIHSCLSDLYKSWSNAKQAGYDDCLEQYRSDINATAFGVGNANTFGFTCSWLSRIEGEDVMRVETKDSSYLVWLER